MLRMWLRHGSGFDNWLTATDRAETSVQMWLDLTTVSTIRHQEMTYGTAAPLPHVLLP